MKIAYFINQYPKVSHSFIRREIQALERQGFEVLRLALRGWDASLPDGEDQRERALTRYVLRRGVIGLLGPSLAAVLRTPVRFIEALRLAIRMSRGSDGRLAYHLIAVAEACRVLQWTMQFDARRIHAHFGTNSAEVVMLARVLGGPPYSFTAHGAEEFLRPMCLDEKVHRSSFVAAVSSFGRSQLYMYSRYADWRKVKVVHCGLEPEFHTAHSVPVGLAPRLICVGRLCETKGQLLLIEAALSLMRKQIPFELVLAGDGPMRPELEAFIRRFRLGGCVRITGWISSTQVREEILAARALVLPSYAEGLPVVIMEAMALCRPVLATYVAGIPELVQHGKHGWLFPAGSLDDLADAMEACLAKEPAELDVMGRAGHERVLARHSIDIEVGKLAQLFRMPAEAREKDYMVTRPADPA